MMDLVAAEDKVKIEAQGRRGWFRFDDSAVRVFYGPDGMPVVVAIKGPKAEGGKP